MCISKFSSHIFIIKRLRHKFCNTRKSFIRQAKLSKLVGVCYLKNLFEEFLVFLCFKARHYAIFKLKLDTLDKLTVTIKRLIKLNPSIGAPPVWRSKNFKRRDITPTTA